MALVSPGVQVSVIDESQYLPAATGSVPFIMIATAQDKVSGSGVGIAAGTTKANANKVYLITSQRDLAATFGNPFFYKTTNGTPINGYELNEYGLLAAYSTLGISNRAYVQRADIDLSQLTASLTRPLGDPANGTYWLDTAGSTWGIFEWSATTSTFTLKSPIVITDADQLVPSSAVPLASVGSIGQYAITAINSQTPTYFKTSGNPSATPAVVANTWVLVGSQDWQNSWPAIIGSATNPSLNGGDTFTVNGTTVTVPLFPNDNVAGVAQAINTLAITGISAQAINGKLQVYADSTATGGAAVLANTSGTALADMGTPAGTYLAPALQQSPNYQVPNWRSGVATARPSGSVWNKTNNVNQGENLVVKKFNSTMGAWVAQSCNVYPNDQTANQALDPAGGGRNIAVGTTIAEYDVLNDGTMTLSLYERYAQGVTAIQGAITDPLFVVGETFTISASVRGSTTMSSPVTATMAGTTAADFVEAFTLANVPYTTASVNSDGSIQIQHTQGGDIILTDTSGTPVLDAGMIPGTTTGVRDNYGTLHSYILSNWIPLTYTASATAPDQDPDDGRLWYYSAVDQVDIMINDGSNWVGYKTLTSDIRGFNLTQTDPNGPQVDTVAPTTQSDGTPLVYGDLWIDTMNLEAYPMLYRWENINGEDQWVLINNTDHTTENGVLFADARWATNGNTDPINDPIPTIQSLLISDYLDLDAPDSELYPNGCLLWNTRRSGFNVKSFQVNYFNSTTFPDTVLPTQTNAWVTQSGNKSDGSPYMGSQAVRQLVVQALKAGMDGNQDLREEQRQFNLIATPQYPELQVNMIALNNERSDTAFVVADTPMFLPDNGTAIYDYVNGANTNGQKPLNDIYMGMFYPSCQTTDLTGSTVVQPPSHMMLRTIIRSDDVAFPWLAPAGTRRGLVDNAFSLGYIDADSGNYIETAIRQSIRDTLYENSINPITFLPGTGIVNYGNKTRSPYTSALDRINVARLICFLRGRLSTIANNYLFEPNDQLTRNEIKNAVQGLLNDIIAKRGIYDYLVVCDESNNTPERIDRNELWVDIAIEPVKAVEFIYIPVRIKNTGEISGAAVSTTASA